MAYAKAILLTAAAKRELEQFVRKVEFLRIEAEKLRRRSR